MRDTPRVGAGATAFVLALGMLPHAIRSVWPMAHYAHGDSVHRALRLALREDPMAVGPSAAEQLLSLLIRVFGTEPRWLEALDKLAVLAVAWMVLRLGRSLAGAWAGAVGALAWCFSCWVLNANLFEPALLATVGTACGLWLYVETTRLSWRRTLALAAALVFAAAMEPRGALVLAALPLHLVWVGRGAEALRLAVIAFLGWALLAAADLFLAGGRLYWGFAAEGGALPAEPPGLADVLSRLGPIQWAGILALLLSCWRRARAPEGAVVLLALGGLVALFTGKPDLEGALVAVTLPLAVMAGLGVDRALSPPQARRTGAAFAVGLALVVGALALDVFTPNPVLTEPVLREALATRWVPGRLGFGFIGGVPRSSVSQRAALAKAHTDAAELLACDDGWVAFQAGRGAWADTSRGLDLSARPAFVLEPLPAPEADRQALRAAGYQRVSEGQAAGWRRP